MSGGAERLQCFIERCERMQEEIDNAREDMKAIKAEAKAEGFDMPTFNLLLKRRKLDPQALIEADMLLETYEAALGCGAQAAGQLVMTERSDGSFGPAMLGGPASPAAAKLDKKTRDFMKLAANAAATAQAVKEG